jgi:MFS family permease
MGDPSDPPETSPLEPSAARNIYSFGITSFFNDSATEMAYWVLPAFLVSLGAGPAQMGLIEGIAESVASLAKLFSGYLTDRLDRRKPIVVAGYFVANAVKPLLAIVTSWWHVLLIRFTDRLAKGVRGAPRDVMVAESVGKQRLGSAYGLIQSLDSAGAIAGPLAALLLLRQHGARSVFLAAAIPGALAVLVALGGIRERRVGPAPGLQPAPKPTPPSPAIHRLPPTFYFLLSAVTLFSLGNSSDMFLVMRAENIGIPIGLAPLLGLVFNLTYTLASWPAGWCSDHFSRRSIAAAGYVIFAGVYFTFAYGKSKGAIWAAMTVYGLYYGLTQPVLKALVVAAVAPEVRGRVLGIYFFLTSVATLGASLISGLLWKRFGPSVPFYASAGCALLSAFALFFGPAEMAAQV